jgi:ketosteroid isomerase-like protein
MKMVHDDAESPALIGEIRRALESQDIEALSRLYNEDAVLEELSALSPPAHPAIVKGREAILERLQKDIYSDPISGWKRHVSSTAIVDSLETADKVAFTEVRTYEAGDKVVAQHIIHKKNGLIEHDRVLVAYDSSP